MSNECFLRVELDEPDRTFHSNEEVRGTVYVQVSGDCLCRGLSVKREWATHGEGARSEGGKHQETLFEGTWVEAGEYSYPFSLTLPHGPYSYQGELLNIDWYVQAEADLARDLKPSAERTFLLGPGPDRIDQPYQAGLPGYSGGPKEAKIQTGGGVKTGTVIGSWAFVFGLILLGLGSLAVALLALTRGWEDRDFMLLGISGALFFFSGAVVVYEAQIRSLQGQKALGRVSVEIDKTKFAPGEEFEVRIDIAPEALIHLEVAQVTLWCTEETNTGEGSQTFMATRRVVDESRTISNSFDVIVDRGESITLRERIRIPDEGPYSFATFHSGIRWSVVVDVTMKKWPKWRRSIGFDVVPIPETEDAQEDSPGESQSEEALVEAPAEASDTMKGDMNW